MGKYLRELVFPLSWLSMLPWLFQQPEIWQHPILRHVVYFLVIAVVAQTVANLGRVKRRNAHDSD